MNGGNIDSLVVEIDDGNGFVRLLSLIGPQQSQETDAWRLSSSDLSSYAGDSVVVRLQVLIVALPVISLSMM
ncbi:MAG: hypothetical protein U5L96_04815 [Owenweeksia sp.]|nr:hypothetical protein [Owenweeksia sp.]